MQPLTIDQYNRLFYRVLVVELGVQQRAVDEGTKVCGLVPTHMQVIDVHMTQVSHHLHLILHCSTHINLIHYQ